MIDYSVLSEKEINVAAASFLGWHKKRESSARLFAEDGTLAVFSFDPAHNLNDCAKLGEKFLAAWPDAWLESRWNPKSRRWEVVTYYFDSEVDEDLRLHARELHTSEARARTVAVLKAWAALDG